MNFDGKKDRFRENGKATLALEDEIYWDYDLERWGCFNLVWALWIIDGL